MANKPNKHKLIHKVQDYNVDLQEGCVGVGQKSQSPLVTLKLPNGSQVYFFREEIDGEAPRIGMMEKIKSGEVPWLPFLSQQFESSPLEVFQSFAPKDEPPPDILRQDHERARKNLPHLPEQPRFLASPGEFGAERFVYPDFHLSAQLFRQGTEVSFFTPLPESHHLAHTADTVSKFGGNLPNHDHSESELHESVNAYTGFSSHRSFSVGNVAGFAKWVTLEYRINEHSSWQGPIMSMGLFPGYRLFYWSDSYPLIRAYKMRINLSSEGESNTYLLEVSY